MRIIILLFIVGVLILNSCNKSKNKQLYPKVITEKNLEKFYDRTKWELYKLNSLIEYGRTDFLLENDSLTDDKLYYYDENTKFNTLNWDLATDKEYLQKVFPEKIHLFVECDLELFEDDFFPIIKEDTITLTFFPICFGQSRVTKIPGSLFHTITYVNGEIIKVGVNDGSEILFVESDLVSENERFNLYLEELEKENIVFCKWLEKNKDKNWH